jgi:AcrR family transcriptional regulator
MSAAPQKKRGRPRDEGSLARRREDILETAARVFAERGYPNADMQEIADALGVGKGTLYRYFASKEELFLTAVDRGMYRLRAAVEASYGEVTDPLERLPRAIRAYLAFFKDHPQFVELLIQERAEFRDRKQSTYFEHRRARAAFWEEVYRGLIRAGRVRDVPVSRILDVINDLVYGTMFTNHFSGQHKPLDEQAEDILDIFFHGILTDSERERMARAS